MQEKERRKIDRAFRKMTSVRKNNWQRIAEERKELGKKKTSGEGPFLRENGGRQSRTPEAAPLLKGLLSERKQRNLCLFERGLGEYITREVFLLTA